MSFRVDERIDSAFSIPPQLKRVDAKHIPRVVRARVAGEDAGMATMRRTKQQPRLQRGETVWLTCIRVTSGMFPTEMSVELKVKNGKEKVIRGFIITEDVKDSRVRAVVARVADDIAALMFRGEIFGATNPVQVSAEWLKEQKSSVA